MNPVSPYKGLAPFDDSELDVRLFFGRERDREVITANLMASRLTVLYGETGVGKSSVLRAGVAHHLRRRAHENLEQRGEPEFAVAVFDNWRDDPVGGLGDAVAQAVGEALGSGPLQVGEGTLAERLADWAEALNGDLYVVLDQAEEYLVYHSGADGVGSFAEQFPDALDRPNLRVNFLLSIREDAVAKLDVFKGRIPNVLSNYLRLEHLDRRSAREAIVGPIAEYNRLAEGEEPVEIEPELVEAVLDQVTAGRLDLGQAGRGALEDTDNGRIESPYLQLVMQRLWQEERAGGSSTLRFETLRRLGGAEQIVRDHLERALADLSPSEKDVAASMFDHLVTPSGTKIAHEIADLAGYAGVGEPQLLPVLSKLGGERILRSVAADGSRRPRYEIFHDVLAEAVLAWKAEHETQRELERQRADSERRHRILRRLVVGAAVAVIAMAGVTIFALTQRSDARAQARRAHARELAATAAAQLQSDPEESLRLAVRSARIEPTSQAEDALRNALLASHVLFVLPAGTGPVRSARFSPDGSRVVTADTDGEARIFSTRDGRLLHTLRHRGPVTSASFSPDGRLAVTTGKDGTTRLWRTDTGEQLRLLRDGAAVTDASFSRDSRLVVTASRDRTARIWNVGTGRLLRVLRHPHPVTHALFSPDGRRVLTVGADRFARLFDEESGRLLHLLAQRGTITSASFSRGGRLVVTSSADQTARIWEAGSGVLRQELVGHVGQVLDATFSPDATRVLTTGVDGFGRVWRVGDGRLVATLVGHTNYVLSGSFSSNGFWIVTSSLDRTGRVWNAETGDPRAVLVGDKDSVVDASFSPDQRTIVTASEDGTARLWESTIQPELGLLARFPGPVAGISLSSDGRLALVAGPGRTTRLIRTDSGMVVRTFGETGPAAAVAFGSAGLVATASDGQVALWRADSGARTRVLRQPGRVTSLALSPKQDRVATGGSDGAARVFTVDGRLLRILRGGRGAVERVSFGPDGRLLATASADGTARIWNLGNGAVAHVLIGHRDAVTSARFSPDGRRVVTSSRDHDARIWDVATGRLLRVLRGHFAFVSDAAFSPDGRWVVTAGPATAGLWRSDTGQLLLFLRGHGKPLTSAWFAPGGRRIITAAADGTVRAYDCEVCGGIDQLVAAAQARLARLTPSR